MGMLDVRVSSPDPFILNRNLVPTPSARLVSGEKETMGAIIILDGYTVLSLATAFSLVSIVKNSISLCMDWPDAGEKLKEAIATPNTAILYLNV